MHAIKKKIVTDENSRPVAVQIDYKDWLEIEGMLEEIRKAEESEAGKSRFKDLLEKTRGTWKHGDGLEYQIRLREEWDDR
ncbi:MAG: hypothetical protein ACRDSJ_08905 [Rubrobacteraceae bacterium]